MLQAHWYFDFISPFAYLQWHQLREFDDDVDFTPRPILFAALLKHWGQLGPAEIAPKRVFTYQYALWLARSRGVPIRAPQGHPFNPLPFLRLSIAAGNSPSAIGSIFEHVWASGGSLSPGPEYDRLAAALGVADTSAIEAPAVKTTLRQNTDAAIAAGVFGVPSIVVAGNVIWGQDATGMLRDEIARPGELARLAEEARAIEPLAERRR